MPAPSRVLRPLTTPLHWMAERLRDRPDSEHEMSFNRLIFAIIIVIVLVMSPSRDDTAPALNVMVLYIALALGVLGHILLFPGRSRGRRLFALLMDCGFLSWQLYLGGEVASLFFPIYLWIIFGNGFRFGLVSLAVAIPVATACFGIVVLTTPFWFNRWHLSAGLLGGLVILPAYAGTLIRKLSQATEAAEEASQAKSLFLASVSHELRTPLTAIVGMTGLLRVGPLAADQRDMVETVDVATRSLQSLINSLLDLSRIEAGRMPVSKEAIDLVALLVDARRLVESQVRERGLSFDIHITARTPLRLLGSRQHLHEILVNLVGNAVKFTRDGGVTIAVDGEPQEDGSVRLTVEITDTGIGIAPKDQERIFEDFTQANPSIMNRFGGTGLGLAIARRLVELLGGSISVESSLGEGSTFRFDILTSTLPDEGLSTEEPWRERGVVLVCRDAAPLAELVTMLGTLGVKPLIADPSRGPARMFPPHAADAVRLLFDPDTANLPLVSTNASGPPPKVVLIRPDAPPTLPAMKIRQRSACLLSQHPTAIELRRALTIACRLAAPAPSLEQAATIDAVPPRRPRSILLADDNRINQRVFSRILEAAGHSVRLAETGEQALDLLEERADQFDIVLMDFNMPDTDGLEATKLFRMMANGGRRLPIVGLTADATALMGNRWREAGMDDCLIKPVEPSVLLALVDRLAKDGLERLVPGEARPALVRPAVLPSLDEVVVERLQKLGSAEFVIELMEDYLSDAEILLERLAKSAAKGDLETFRSDDHALQSSSANIGALALGRICASWRDLRSDELRAGAADFARQSRAELKRTQKAMRAYSAREAGLG
ncbi:two-component system, sensor histidine kinase RpfC [Kaistia soli DSM 19436]|uniref:histidine kinase n=2 Tax=Kaistia TaxID=166953 RepID=A0A1M5FKU5_9HYPH|nr:two-component system, sensor histidine kinase RpfC [Kaistia soli DSM 19436]